MKKTPLKQTGRIGKINQKANRKIARMWLDKGIDFCEACAVLDEMGLLGWQCLQASSNSHRHGRVWYRGKPELLWNIKQVIRACMKAHDFIDNNPVIREEVFEILRGEE